MRFVDGRLCRLAVLETTSRELLDKLIVCDTRAAADSIEAAEARKKLAKDVLAQGTSMLVETMIPKLFSRMSRENKPDIVHATTAVIRTANRWAWRQHCEEWRIDPTWRIGCPRRNPTLVVCGEDDAISGVSEMSEIADQLPQATFVVVPDCGHMAPLEDPRIRQSGDARLSQGS